MSDQLLLMIAIDVIALALIGFAFTVHEFRQHVIEDPHQPRQIFHGEKVEYRLGNS